MLAELKKRTMVLPSMCDDSGNMGIPQIFSVFMDLAMESAECLGLGLSAIGPQKLFWVTVRTKVVVNRLPAMNTYIDLHTWPERPERVRSNRSYRISQNGIPLIEGRTEWAVINIESGRLQSPAGLFGSDMEFIGESAAVGEYTRRKDSFDEPPFAEYRVLSTDIDVGGHMNNAAYIKAAAGFFGSEQIHRRPIREIEVNYKAQSYEGDVLKLYKKYDGTDTLVLRAENGEGKTVIDGVVRF